MTGKMLFGLVWIFAFTAALHTPDIRADETSFIANPNTQRASIGKPLIINETGKMNDSPDSNWWVNSGAQISRSGNILSTVQGRLPDTDPFRLLYASSNPVDTDNGYRPQNILRLVTRAKFRNATQQVFFNISHINASNSPNRNQSNGVLFFQRYQDGDNLYYSGIRVDGEAVLKKKFKGKYSTLKSVAVYPGSYHRDTLPNLLPMHRWIGIKTEIKDTDNYGVEISFYINDNQLGLGWTRVLHAVDSCTDAECITNAGYAGIRSDFMDISFESYQVFEINKPVH